MVGSEPNVVHVGLTRADLGPISKQLWDKLTGIGQIQAGNGHSATMFGLGSPKATETEPMSMERRPNPTIFAGDPAIFAQHSAKFEADRCRCLRGGRPRRLARDLQKKVRTAAAPVFRPLQRNAPDMSCRHFAEQLSLLGQPTPPGSPSVPGCVV